MIRVTIVPEGAPSADDVPALVFRDRKELEGAVARRTAADRALTESEATLLQAVAKSLPEEIVGLVEVIASKGMFQLAWKRLPD